MAAANNDDYTPFPHFATNAIHVGQSWRQRSSRDVLPPISLTTTFAIPDISQYRTSLRYSRLANPTRDVAQQCIASLENGKYCLLYGSGIGATLTATHLLNAGEHVVAMNDLYGGTNCYFREVASKFNIKTSFVDMTNLSDVKAAMKPNTRMVWVETPTNPTMRIVDIKAVCDIAQQYPDVFVVVDNTFATPYFQRPLDLGADIVLHSLTKYMNGHMDLLMGALITSNQTLYEKLTFLQYGAGAIPSSFDCFLVNRGLKTLHLRMKEHQRNGLAVAKFLESHPLVEKVLHPGLPSHPDYELAKRQMRGYSGMVAFYIKGGLEEATTFLESVKIFTPAVSLGGYASLAELPATMTHNAVAREELESLGIHDNLIRLSVGLEDAEDLIGDLVQAFKMVVA